MARDLIGCTLLVDGVGGRLVEVEAYAADDPASHGFRGPTERNRAMFGPPGHAYVYRSYGIHWMLNLVCECEGTAAAVLVRAIVPQHRRDVIASRRTGVGERDWCRGPGRVGVALAVGPHLDGLPLDTGPFRIEPRTTTPDLDATVRIGITRAADLPWRFVERGSRYVSSAGAARPRRR